MRLSVVIPARNEEDYLEHTLAALAAQTLPPLEVIVVDNGSTDNTAQVAKAAGAKVVFCEEPGVARARQMGLEAAKGTWVASTDADSLPPPRWLEQFARYSHDSVAVYGPLRFYGLSPAQEDFSELAYRYFLKTMMVLRRPNLAAANMAFSREAALQVGGWPQVPTSEDVLFGLALQRVGSVRYVSEAVVATSARRYKRKGAIRYFYWQFRNMIGLGKGYFDNS